MVVAVGGHARHIQKLHHYLVLDLISIRVIIGFCEIQSGEGCSAMGLFIRGNWQCRVGVVVCVDFLGILMAFNCKLELSYVHPERLVQIACDSTNHVHDYIGKGHMLAIVFRGANGDPLKCCTISKPIKGTR